jgi:hypothetical protein
MAKNLRFDDLVSAIDLCVWSVELRKADNNCRESGGSIVEGSAKALYYFVNSRINFGQALSSTRHCNLGCLASVGKVSIERYYNY